MQENGFKVSRLKIKLIFMEVHAKIYFWHPTTRADSVNMHTFTKPLKTDI